MEVSVASVTVSVAVVVVSWWVWRTLQWVWFKPKTLERYLRRQGLAGTPYTPLVGDLKRNFSMLAEARSKPIKLTDDITPRVVPYPLQMLKTHGRTFYTWLGPIPTINIMDPEQIKEVFNKVYDFQKVHTFPLARLIAAGLVSYDGDKWAKHRRIINPAFHLEKIKNMVPAFHQSCSEIVGEWDKLVSDKESSCEVDVWPGLVSMTADVISRTAFGSSYVEGQRIFELQAELAQLIIQAFQKAFIPGYHYLPTKGNRRMKAAAREIQVILRGIVNKRLRAREAGEAPSDDLLGILLDSNLGQTEGNGMSTEDVMEECKLFYFAGQETTTVLLVWTMVLLSQHQDWQARAREEVKQVFGDKEPDTEGLNQLKVMTMILYEVLRLYPPVSQLTRAIHKEMKLGDLTLPGGVHISLPIMLVQRDTELWGKDAAEFKPERFKDGLSKATKSQVSFFPFAWGQRICIGQNFALLEAKMAMALILQKFSFELSPSYVHAPDTVFTIHPQFGAPLILHKL
ncbi:Cytochrome P450 superfamily [Arabidopsis thaliana x Arabidopsis arenosa]|uniref:Cytochrome P450 superfamily n=1 Tax=Arabidopsis thaliana x Arabidopsis arenosa TaxID=1240361 RepID=A0A8T2AVZ8_9BRAS|nr:Cytochrome P450 superfamily [Arabidopsis thaliana x Arabidopsis arenosa]